MVQTTRKSRRRRRREPEWVDLPDEQLLDERICDLDLTIEGTPLEGRIEKLYDELEQRGLDFRPHCWLSDEWFSPDGVPGIAIPFYLAHPRLARLERKQLLEVEGGTEEWCLRILRHEAGHCIDTAYRLHRRRRWREMFGNYTQPYPEFYKPKPYSKSYVLHLEPWYAQSHPAEDFAETFAVWLKPRSRWRTQYEGWPALKKCEYVDELMEQIAEEKPTVTSRRHIDAVRSLKKTLREHYQERRDRYGIDTPNIFDRDLRRLFSDAPEHAGCPSAAAFLRRIRGELRRIVAEWTGEYRYTIDQVLGELIDRCRELNLRLHRPVRQAKKDSLVLLTVLTMNYIHGGHHRIAL
ncbi:MAG: putative zinc-binding metallopeptidase [Pirellulaceae bacterium]